MTNRTDSVLTPADEAEIRAEAEAMARRYGWAFKSEDADRRVREITSAVERFCEPSQYRTAEVTSWRAKVMEFLTEEYYTPLRLDAKPVSHEDLVADWEAKCAAHESDWDGGYDGDEPFSPWEGFEAAQAFLSTTPYHVWKVAEAVRSVARDAESEALFMATGQGFDVKKMMQEAFDKEIARLREEADQAAEAA